MSEPAKGAVDTSRTSSTTSEDPAVAAALKRVEQAQAALKRAKARSSQKARKIDARRKIILGGALLELARRGGSADSDDAARMVRSFLREMTRENDRKAFEGFEL